MQSLPPSLVMQPRGTQVTMVGYHHPHDEDDAHADMLLMMIMMSIFILIMITTINISGYYREAPVVVLRGPQPHQQQAHQHQAQHQQQVLFSSSVHVSERIWR